MIDSAVDLTVHDRGAGPAVVLVHGWMCDRQDASGLARLLEGDHRVLSMDLRGHGDNASVGTSFGLADFVADLADVIVSRVEGGVVVCGHSMGGAVAVALAMARPELVAGIVAIDAPWILSPPDGAAVDSVAALWGAAYEDRAGRIVAARRRVLAPGIAVDVPRRDVAARSFESLMAWDGPAATAAVACPIVAIASDGHLETMRAAAAHLSHVRVESVSGTGHWAQVERPGAVAAQVRALTAEVLP